MQSEAQAENFNSTSKHSGQKNEIERLKNWWAYMYSKPLQDLAKALGVTRQTVTYWERNGGFIPLAHRKVVQDLGFKLEWDWDDTEFLQKRMQNDEQRAKAES